MYLVAFVFLMISILGLYSQIYALQASKVLANQTAAADQMLTWHTAAHKFIRDGIANPDPTRRLNIINTTVDLVNPADDVTDGCWLSNRPVAPLPIWCNNSAAIPTSLEIPFRNQVQVEASGYNTPNWSFNTVVYRVLSGATPTSNVYVITWVPAPAAANGLTVSPNTGFTTTELAQQLKRSQAARGSISSLGSIGNVRPGGVGAANVVVDTLTGTNIPVPASVAVGSIAIISIAGTT